MKRGESRFRTASVFLILGLPLWVLSSSRAKDLGPDFVDVSQIPGVWVDLRYASSNNFMGEDLYLDFRTAALHTKAAKKLREAARLLQKRNPGWTLLVFDALRPRDVQQRLWDKVKGTDKQSYVADPQKGSVHNYGFAVDLSLRDENGVEVDMGTPFDAFEPLAQPKVEDQFALQGKLTSAQMTNRRLLREVMEKSGFKQLSFEWWHFDALSKEKARNQYPIVETFEFLTKRDMVK